MTNSSLFSSLGAALQAFPSPRFHFKAHSLPLKTSPILDSFEAELTAQLQELRLLEDSGCLTLPWLSQAMGVVLSTHSNVEAFVPDLEKALIEGKISWLDEYLEESIKLLDICNLLKDTVLDIKSYHLFVELALHSLQKGSFVRARNALAKCSQALRRKDDEFAPQAQKRSKLETYCSILRRMGEMINTEDTSKGHFFSVLSAAQLTTIFICSVLTASLCFKPRRPFSSMVVSGQSQWALCLASLQQKVKEQVEKRKAKGSSALLEELDRTDLAVRNCQELVDKVLVKKVLSLEMAEVKELMKAVMNLRKMGDALVEGLDPLEQQICDLFRLLVTSRMALLDIYSHSCKGKL